MNSGLTDEQRLIRKPARDFTPKELAPHARDWEESSTFSGEAFEKMSDLDFTGLYIPEECGGTGVGGLTAAVIFEELAKGCLATAVYISVHNVVANLIYTYGNEEQRKRWVEPLATGEALGAYS